MGDDQGPDDPKQRFVKSLKELIERRGERVRGFVAARMRGALHHGIDDVTQETYARLLRLLPGQSIDNLEAYVLQVAANVAKDFATKQSREQRHVIVDCSVLDWLSDNGMDGHDDPALKALEKDEDLGQLTECLSPLMRTIVLLHARDELSYEEIGKKLGYSPHTVRKYWFTALAHCSAQQTSVKTRGTVR